MRTTLTLDPDVAAALDRLRRTDQRSFKAIINDLLRRGLAQMRSGERERRPFHTSGVSLGRCLVGSLDDVAETLAVAEGEAFR